MGSSARDIVTIVQRAIAQSEVDMSKAGDKLIAAMNEAAAVARGEISAHSITMQGRTYVPIEECEAMKLRAIMAERERCANIAEDAAIDVPMWMNHPQGREDQARISIADAIRK